MELVKEMKIQSYAVLFGSFRVASKIPKWVLGKSVNQMIRESPPECLVDPELGRHLYVKINDCKYHYVENGSRRNTLVICLHDFTDFWYGWRNQLKELSKSFWVVALDLKGFGDSEKPYLSRNYSDDVIIEEIKKFVDIIHEKKKKIVILGHGLGGQIGWKLVETHPEMVSKFVSISTPHPKIWLSHLTRSWTSMIHNRWLYECRLPFLPELQMVDNDLEVFDKRFKKWNSTVDLANYSNFDKEAYKYTFSRTVDWQGCINYYRNLPLSKFEKVSENDIPGTIPVETLFLVGNMDPELSLDLVSQSAKFVERFALQIIPGSGHSPHQEYPESVNRHIEKFINDEMSYMTKWSAMMKVVSKK